MGITVVNSWTDWRAKITEIGTTNMFIDWWTCNSQEYQEYERSHAYHSASIAPKTPHGLLKWAERLLCFSIHLCFQGAFFPSSCSSEISRYSVLMRGSMRW